MSLLPTEIDELPLFVTAVEFGEEEIMITFQEKRDIGETVALGKSIVIGMSNEDRRTVYMELQKYLQEVVDDGLGSLHSEAD